MSSGGGTSNSDLGRRRQALRRLPAGIVGIQIEAYQGETIIHWPAAGRIHNPEAPQAPPQWSLSHHGLTERSGRDSDRDEAGRPLIFFSCLCLSPSQS